MLRQFIRFAGVGGIATILMYLLLIVLVEWLAVAPVPASVLAYILSAIFNYIANYRFTFDSTVPHQKALPRFMLIATAGLALNTLIMFLLTDILPVHYLLAQVVATGVVLIWNFVANRRWTYTAHKV